MSIIGIIRNPRSGIATPRSADFERLIKEHTDYPIKVYMLDGSKDVYDLVMEAWKDGCRTIVAAGGDGTVSSVASAIVDNKLDVKFGVLPMGTYNHFAKDIGLPTDLEAAFTIVLKNKTIFVDIAKVNDTFFINNSSLGIYPSIVQGREELQRNGWKKKIAFLWTLIAILSRHPFITVDFKTNGKKISKDTPFIFIGNNKYELAGLKIGTRVRLDQGTLFVCMAHKVGRFGMLMLGFHTLRGKLMEQRDFDVIGLQECTIDSSKKKLLVSYDGEVKAMKKPITYKIVPKALCVIVGS